MTTQQVDPLRACKEAQDKLKRVREKLKSYGQYFSSLATALCEDEVRLRLANSNLSVPINLPPDRTLDYNDWPEQEEVIASLAEYYEADKEWQAAYNRLAPDEQRLFDGEGGARGPGSGRQRVQRMQRV